MKLSLFSFFLFFVPVWLMAQDKDSTVIIADSASIVIPEQSIAIGDTLRIDTAKQRQFSPRQAAIRSAILPGLGQIYNKKYWKVPIVYAAVGIPVGLFFYNKTWYNRTRYALAVVASPNPSQDSVNRVHEQLISLVTRNAEGSLLRYRNEFRRNMDYSVLITLLFWGLNVVDATVDAHLKGFDVSEDLSMQIKPVLLPGNAPGLSLVFTIGKNRPNTISSLH